MQWWLWVIKLNKPTVLWGGQTRPSHHYGRYILAIVEIFVLITENYKALNFLRNLPKNTSSCILTSNSIPPYKPASKRWFIYIYFSVSDQMNKRFRTTEHMCLVKTWENCPKCNREYMNAIGLHVLGIVSLLILLFLFLFLIVDIDF